jgi:hypothetical protein
MPEDVGDIEEIAPDGGGGRCTDCDDDRREKNGIDDGVSRFEWDRRIDAAGLSGPG